MDNITKRIKYLPGNIVEVDLQRSCIPNYQPIKTHYHDRTMAVVYRMSNDVNSIFTRQVTDNVALTIDSMAPQPAHNPGKS